MTTTCHNRPECPPKIQYYSGINKNALQIFIDVIYTPNYYSSTEHANMARIKSSDQEWQDQSHAAAPTAKRRINRIVACTPLHFCYSVRHVTFWENSKGLKKQKQLDIISTTKFFSYQYIPSFNNEYFLVGVQWQQFR
jgi:hypothetical protein